MADVIVRAGRERLKSSGPAIRKGRLEGNEAAAHRQNFFSIKETSALLVRSFNLLDEAHPGYLEYIQLLKVHWVFGVFQLY